MSSLKGTQTEKNLMQAFAGESQARNRYTYFASKAKSEGYVLISSIFEETANQEKEHAKRFFKFLEGGCCEITATFPAGKIGTTLENLKAAAEGENEEWSKDYPMFADIAEKEGFPEIAAVFRAVAKAEKELGGGTGELKLRYVYDLFIRTFPSISKAITFDSFSFLVDTALEKLNFLLENNDNIQEYIQSD
jgi:rubrerythrin